MANHQDKPCEPCEGGPEQAGSVYECPELLDETAALLRSRLYKVALIFLAAFSLMVAAGFFMETGHGSLSIFVWVMPFVFGALALLLRSPLCLCLFRLRFFEFAVFGAAGAFHVLRHFLVVDEIIGRQGPALVPTAACLNVLIWFFLIVLYAMFIPNTWRRAAVMIGVMAAAPLVVNLIVEWQYPAVAAVTPPDLRVVLVLVTLMGIAASVYGTHTINRLRT